MFDVSAASSSGLEHKPVYDSNHLPLGTITGAAVDPKTRDPTELIIRLHPQARQSLRSEDNTLSLPFDLVFGIRRDEVTLSRSLPELMGLFTERQPPTHEEVLIQR